MDLTKFEFTTSKKKKTDDEKKKRKNKMSNTNMYLICIYVIGNEKNRFWSYLI
jgi:hypothetical protein